PNHASRGATVFAPLFRRHVLDDADQEREDDAADDAAADIADPALNRLSGERANDLAEDTAADRTGDRVAERSQRVLLGRRASRAAADRPRDNLNKETGEIHGFPPSKPTSRVGAWILGVTRVRRQDAETASS